jgi:hypothetical protein
MSRSSCSASATPSISALPRHSVPSQSNTHVSYRRCRFAAEQPSQLHILARHMRRLPRRRTGTPQGDERTVRKRCAPGDARLWGAPRQSSGDGKRCRGSRSLTSTSCISLGAMGLIAAAAAALCGDGAAQGEAGSGAAAAARGAGAPRRLKFFWGMWYQSYCGLLVFVSGLPGERLARSLRLDLTGDPHWSITYIKTHSTRINSPTRLTPP